MRAYIKHTMEGSNDTTRELYKSAFIVKNVLRDNLNDEEYNQTLVNLYKALRKACNLPNNHITVAKGAFKDDPDNVVYVVRIFDSIADGNVYEINIDENRQWYIEIPEITKEGESSWDSNVNEE